MTTAKTLQRRLPLAVTLLVIAGVVLVYRISPYVPYVRNQRFARMSIDEMLRVQGNYINDPLFLYHLGRKLNRSGQFAAADPYLERAAGLDPDSAQVRDEWVQALMGHGRVTIAFGIIRQFMATHPQAPEPPLMLGKFYLSREDWDHASKALETATRLAPQNAEAWSLRANALIKMGKYGDAQAALDRAIQLKPDDANNHLQLAVLIQDSDKARARREYLRTVALAPADPVGLRQYGRFLLDNGDPSGAEAQARAAITKSPTDALAQQLLGRALMAQSRWQEAAAPLEEAARLTPTDPQPAEQLRRVYRQTHQADQAARWSGRYLALMHGEDERRRLLDATHAHPKDPALHHQLAAALARIGDVNGSVREEAFAFKTTPDNARTLTAAAQDLDRAGYYSEALPLARQAAMQRLNPTAQETLANILLHLGRLHEAAVRYEQIRDWKADKIAQYRRQLLEASIRINNSAAPAELLLRAARREPDSAKAEEMLTRAIQIEPDNTRCLRALMQLQFSHHETEQTLATATRLFMLSPEDGVAHTYYVSARLNALGDGPISDAEYQDLARHLSAATKDPSVVYTIYYDRGLIDLKRGQLQAAVNDFDAAQHLNPNAIDVYQKLAEAKSRIGDKVGAQQTLAQFDQRQKAQKLLAH